MAENEKKVPDQKELEKELSDYLSKKYGSRIKVVSPLMLPKAAEESGGDESATGNEAVNKIKTKPRPFLPPRSARISTESNTSSRARRARTLPWWGESRTTLS